MLKETETFYDVVISVFFLLLLLLFFLFGVFFGVPRWPYDGLVSES